MDIIRRAINKNNVYTYKPQKRRQQSRPILKYALIILSLIIIALIIFFIARPNQQNLEEGKIVIIEGWNSNEIADYLANFHAKYAADKKTNYEEIKANFRQEFLQEVNNAGQYDYGFLADKPKNASLEGYLYPDTYNIYRDATPSEIITKMLDNFGQKINKNIRNQAKAKNLTLFETLTLASIVQKEVKTPEEMKTVAGLYFNRLNNDKALESDSTITYFTGKKETRASKKDLKIDNPYNTYKYKGLPPGPIGNPCLNAITAVLNPIQHNYFYFITDENGKAIFSETGEEHVEKVEEHLN